MEEKFDKYACRAIFISAFIIMVLCVIAGVVGEKNKWNDGRCPSCETKWEYVKTVNHYDGEEYGSHSTHIYKCPKCGKMIEISELK